MSNDQDKALIKNCLQGNTKAFETLVGKYQHVIFNTALKMVGDYQDARDVAQTVFVRAYEQLGAYDPSYKFFSWIYKMAVNESINTISRRKGHAPLPDDSPAAVAPPDEEIERDEICGMVQEAIAELPIEYRVILVLRHFADLSYRDLSYILDIPEKTVKSRLFTARQRLGDVLRNKGILKYD
jgi:RNA polymerase sigma-70 factor (ECF subfamily)